MLLFFIITYLSVSLSLRNYIYNQRKKPRDRKVILEVSTDVYLLPRGKFLIDINSFFFGQQFIRFENLK